MCVCTKGLILCVCVHTGGGQVPLRIEKGKGEGSINPKTKGQKTKKGRGGMCKDKGGGREVKG